MSAPSITSSDQNPCLAWEDYPLENAGYFTPGKDRTFYRQLLNQNQTRIFELDRIKLEVIRMVRSDNCKS